LTEQDRNIRQQLKKAEILAIGGSAGAFQTILDILAAFPKNIPLTIVVLIHRGAQLKSELSALLNNITEMEVMEANDKQPIEKGRVYLSPLHYHLLAEPGKTWSLDAGEPVWFCRPSIDVLFESVADVFEEKAVGILLSGANQDGAYGLKRMKDKNAVTLVQSPDSSEYPAMPEAAIRLNKQHEILTKNQILEFCRSFVNELKK
jgi:two-component system, chemotaxis family, protein-glutamate methylesterase/glutaminase